MDEKKVRTALNALKSVGDTRQIAIDALEQALARYCIIPLPRFIGEGIV